MRAIIAFALISALLLAGCSQYTGDSELGKQSQQAAAGNQQAGVNQQAGAANQNQQTNTNGVDQVKNNSNAAASSQLKNPTVVFETTKGMFKAEIYLKEAPITANNFLSLASRGFYNNLTFHRVEPNFVVQGGDPLGTGAGGSGINVPLEIKPNLKHVLGSLGMARSSDPNSASSQFYVVTGPASFLDGQYAVFGQVQGSGMDVVNKLRIGDRMTKVYVEN